MDLLGRIIREEVDKLFLNESNQYNWFNQLSKYSKVLATQLKQLSKEEQKFNKKDVLEFLEDLALYGNRVIIALNRCIKKQNINEDLIPRRITNRLFSPSRYGVKLPSELTFWDDAVSGYNSMKNFLTSKDQKKYNYVQKTQDVDDNQDEEIPNQDKLSYLLGDLRGFEIRKENLERKYNSTFEEISRVPSQIIASVHNIELVCNIMKGKVQQPQQQSRQDTEVETPTSATISFADGTEQPQQWQSQSQQNTQVANPTGGTITIGVNNAAQQPQQNVNQQQQMAQQQKPQQPRQRINKAPRARNLVQVRKKNQRHNRRRY